MLFWEGIVFLFSNFLVGFYLFKMILKDARRHNQLKVFFSGFTHDIKTSITRLRLQSEVLQDSNIDNPKLIQLLKDIARLDLQLENSLFMADLENAPLFFEKLQLTEIIQVLRYDFPEVEFYLEKNPRLIADRRILFCVFRNLIHNSIIHGGATQIRFNVSSPTMGNVCILVEDNGTGAAQFQNSEYSKHLDQEPIKRSGSKGLGLGLYICKQLIKRNHGIFKIKQTHPEFIVSVDLKGTIL